MKQSPHLRDSLAGVYDKLYSHSNRLRFERWVVTLSVAGYLIHLALVFLSRSLANPPALIAAVGINYLSAIYTPFSFILFYEVVVLIGAIPESMAQSVANQFEIVSLIFVRGFFKHIAEIDDLGKLRRPSAEMLAVLTDVCAGLLMFLLVTVFQHVSLRRKRAGAESERSRELLVFIARKKAIALPLMIWVFGLALHALIEFAGDTYHILSHGPVIEAEPQTIFYVDVFSVMIFTDVLILIMSLAISDRYALVLRNAAFVVATILIRISLTTEHPYGGPLALFGMVFGIVTMLIYRYNSNLHLRYPGADRDAIS
jgi:hypothetical protein